MKRLNHLENAALIEVARGDRPAGLVLRNAQVVNVFTGQLEQQDVAIYKERIAGVGNGYKAEQEVDLSNHVLSPGFIDGHMHLESSMVTPEEFARAVVPRGTTSVVTDPHEIANVLGAPGIRYMLEASKNSPLDMFVMLSSCVPATHLENAGATLTAGEIESWSDPRILGLAEMMNFPGVVHGFEDCLKKIEAAGTRRADGHAPKLSGMQLNAYVAAGIESDHECTTAAEALEKLKLGMYILIREGSVTRDLEPLLKIVNPQTMRRCLFCTDDREPIDLLKEGHIDFCIRKAIRLGCDPISAIIMGSLNVADYFGLKFVGAIAPGFAADLVVLDQDLKKVQATRVMKRGQWVAENGKPLWHAHRADDSTTRKTVHLPELHDNCFKIRAEGETVEVIELIPGQIVTAKSKDKPKIQNGFAEADPTKDLLKMAVIERHRATGNIGLGFVRGFGLQSGAIASTVAHDSHNLVIAGTNDEDMRKAAKALQEVDGGLVVVDKGEIKARLPMPVAGLMSDQDLETVQRINQELIDATKALGGKAANPFMSLSFLALPVIPTLKLTDLGLVDVDKFDFVPLFA